MAPSHFAYGPTQPFGWASSPAVIGSSEPWLNPKAGKFIRMAFAGHVVSDGEQNSRLGGAKIVDGLPKHVYLTIGSGAVDWFNMASETGSVLARPFECSSFARHTWSLY